MKDYTHLIFLGAPGSGKGTQAKKLLKDCGHVHISTGDLLRDEVAKKSELGQKIDSIMQQGKLVDDEIVFELLKRNCDLSKSGHIFDGFPRNFEQAKALDDKIMRDSRYLVLYFKIDEGILISRLTSRRVCKRCGEIFNLHTLPSKKCGLCDKCGGELQHRKDDKEDVIKERMSVFEKSMNPVFAYYKDRGILKELDASLDSETLYGLIKKIIF